MKIICNNCKRTLTYTQGYHWFGPNKGLKKAIPTLLLCPECNRNINFNLNGALPKGMGI